MKKKQLSEVEKGECRALRAIWNAKKDSLGLTQQGLADAIGDGITQGAVGHYLNGRNALNLSIAVEFSRVLGVPVKAFSPRLHAAIPAQNNDVAAIADVAGHYNRNTNHVVAVTHKTIPLAATINGKMMHVGEDSSLEPMYYQASWIKKMGLDPDKLVVRQVKGSSMEPALFDGDSVLINCDSREPIHGRTYWVMVEGEACVKRIVKLQGSWWISSDNRAYGVKDIQLESPEQIMGEVVIKSSSHI